MLDIVRGSLHSSVAERAMGSQRGRWVAATAWLGLSMNVGGASGRC